MSAIDSNRRTIWIADAHRDTGKRFVVRADEKLTAFMELESANRAVSYWLQWRSRVRVMGLGGGVGRGRVSGSNHRCIPAR